jgi:hypothetical protein
MVVFNVDALIGHPPSKHFSLDFNHSGFQHYLTYKREESILQENLY